MKVTKNEIIDMVAELTQNNKASVKEVFNTIIEVIMNEVANGNEVQFGNIGIFKSKLMASREARNPSTGEVFQTEEKMVPKFKVGKAFKEIVKGN